ncbi:8231_t:CDS:2, partial [Gigaspora margarita]
MLDLWMSPNNKGFIAITAHYIDDNWALQEVIIDFGLMSRKHNGTNIVNGFFKVLENYDITSKILAITLDNAANNNILVQELETKLRDVSNIEWDSECLQFWCFNHILNSAVQTALNCIKDVVNM